MRELNACGDRVSRDRFAGYAVVVEARIPLLQWWECQNYRAESFERIRRITGYLVGSLSRFNNAKRAEEHDRIKHSL